MVDADYYKIVMNPQLGLFDPRWAATNDDPFKQQPD
jgi:hypothetical protein